MNNIKTITKYAFKEQFFPYFPSKKIAGMPKNYLGRLISLIWSYLFFGFIFYLVMGSSVKVFVESGKEAMYFTVFAMLMTVIVLLLHGAKIYSDFFTEKSIANYQTMPITEGELFLGNIFGGVLSFFDYFLFFLLGLFLYFSAVGFDLGALLIGIINFFPMILVPYAILAIILLIIKKFTNVNRHKKLFKNLGYVLMFAIIGAIYYFSFKSGQSGDSFDKFANGIVDAANKNQAVSNIFFQAKLFGLSLTGGIGQRILSTIVLYALAGLITFIAYKLGGKFYYNSVFENTVTEEASEKIKKDKKKKTVGISQKSQVMAIAKRDFSIMTSNLMFLYTPILMAMIFTILPVTQGRELIGEIGYENVFSPVAKFYIFAVAFGAGLMIWINGAPTSNSLSREGKGFFLIQILPVDPKSHMKGRLLSAMAIACPINLIMTLIIGVILKLGFVNSLMIFLGLSLSALSANIVGLLLSTIGINTTWQNPKELMQGGMRFFIFYIISFVVIIALVILTIALMSVTNGKILIGIGVPVLIVIILTGIFYGLALKRYKKGFMDV
ncbi:Uncharacterised protein [Anaerococcus prevotii]|uniref:ABC-2 type transport system permease protein n=1 Tax=Anaerococcus prevotii (strain ATCC 9321 / DSM 20548 / JCM 6508 / NCTC 11806 / PC1) TaxID=525919 RepID=C7RG46_ANAPD|nr:hypothetical protein [Anaerococcus prevotii]ACV28457.1 hypothetical protein Apre_0408 [Anaerococcus prevotii DSM 20548]SUU94016.1 Uncharacterised protein [Anaerococcus prevotii]